MQKGQREFIVSLLREITVSKCRAETEKGLYTEKVHGPSLHSTYAKIFRRVFYMPVFSDPLFVPLGEQWKAMKLRV